MERNWPAIYSAAMFSSGEGARRPRKASDARKETCPRRVSTEISGGRGAVAAKTEQQTPKATLARLVEPNNVAGLQSRSHYRMGVILQAKLDGVGFKTLTILDVSHHLPILIG